jgi:hypothetical protein
VPSPRLELVRQSTQSGLVAKWNGSNSEYTLFHDTNRPAELRFKTSDRDSRVPETDETSADFFSQKRRFVRSIDSFYDEISHLREPQTVSRRPDVVVIRRDETSGKVTNVLVGEAKYTRSRKTVREGVEQLLETVLSLHVNRSGRNEYLASSGELLEDDRVEAALFVDESPFRSDAFPEELAVYEYGESSDIPF